MSGQAQAGGHLWRMLAWGGATALMSVPVAMTLAGDEMKWSGGDFALAAALLLALCGAWELAYRRSRDWAYAAAAAVAAGTGLLLFAANGAVGLVGDEGNVANLLFFGVLTLAAGGAFAVRLRASGMARVMVAAAAAQVAAAGLAAAIAPDPRGLVFSVALFMPLWLLSAGLFARAARAGAD